MARKKEYANKQRNKKVVTIVVRPHTLKKGGMLYSRCKVLLKI